MIVEIDSNKICKLAATSALSWRIEIEKIIIDQINNPKDYIVPVHSYENLPTVGGMYPYRYVMDKLIPLNHYERILFKLFQSKVIMLEDKHYSPGFYEWLLNNKEYNYHDWKASNIMKDDIGEFRIIDLEGFVGH